MTPRSEVGAGHRGDRLRLVALLDGQIVGSVHQSLTGRLRFAYEDAWREDPAAYPLSLSMPLAAREHPHDAISAFLWGLLPDNNRTLDHYGRLFNVSSATPIALLAHIGMDCAGAIQFASPEHVAALVGHAKRSSEADWLTPADIAEELRTVRKQGISGTNRRTVGQFSLAGAQPKIALLEEDGRWGRPAGRTPTNRILKPPSLEYHGFAENEHFCLGLASELGLGSVRSRVLQFDDEIAIVVDRFDRVRRGGSYRRVHQEEVCQALAVMPTRKYENEGGPGIRDVISVLRDSSRQPDDDIDRFIGLLVLNWVIAAPDGHAKNYALLHGPGGGTRLAPFYDIASYLPYADAGLHRVKLAMKIGSNYLVRRIARSSWEALAKANGIPVSHVLQQAEKILSALPSAIETVHNAAIDEGLDERFVDELSGLIVQRVQSCSAAMSGQA